MRQHGYGSLIPAALLQPTSLNLTISDWPADPSLERTRGSVVSVHSTPSLACARARAAQLRR
jgi:hypothetical protein